MRASGAAENAWLGHTAASTSRPPSVSASAARLAGYRRRSLLHGVALAWPRSDPRSPCTSASSASCLTSVARPPSLSRRQGTERYGGTVIFHFNVKSSEEGRVPYFIPTLPFIDMIFDKHRKLHFIPELGFSLEGVVIE